MSTEPPRLVTTEKFVPRPEVRGRRYAARHADADPREMSTIATAWARLIKTRRAYHEALEQLRQALGGGPHD